MDSQALGKDISAVEVINITKHVAWERLGEDAWIDCGVRL
jgi:hypothetical protein